MTTFIALCGAANANAAQGDVNGYLIGKLASYETNLVTKSCKYEIPARLIRSGGIDQEIYTVTLHDGRSNQIGVEEIRSTIRGILVFPAKISNLSPPRPYVSFRTSVSRISDCDEAVFVIYNKMTGKLRLKD